jgi:hypothetical protein
VFAVHQNLCRAFFVGRTAKSLFAVRFLSGARQRKNARQTSSLPCARQKTHGKELICRACFFLVHDKVFFSPHAHRIN